MRGAKSKTVIFKGCEIFFGSKIRGAKYGMKIKGYEKNRQKFKGYEKISQKFKGSEKMANLEKNAPGGYPPE